MWLRDINAEWGLPGMLERLQNQDNIGMSVTHGLLQLATSSGHVASPAGSGTGAGVIWNHSRF